MANFNSRQDVVSAYTSRGIATWAVFDKKNLMMSGSDENSLSDYLDLMEKQGGRTTYTLKVYKAIDPDDVMPRTEENAAFSFQLSDGGSIGGFGNGAYGSIGARLSAIEKKLNGEGAEEKQPSLIGTVLGWLQDPDDVIKIVGAAKMLFGKPTPEQVLQTVTSLSGTETLNPHRAGIAAAQPAEQNSTVMDANNLTPEQQQLQMRLATAISRLEKCDPNILVNLEKLANLAETNPAMYQMAVKMLG